MNDYISFLSACLAPVVAVVGLVFAGLQWWTTERERQNTLFDRRFNFYTRLKQIYLSQHDRSNPPLTEEDWSPLAEEAGFLFGDDIERFVSSLADKKVEGSPFFPNEWFVAPFRKYLRF
jgi:hypothetical protein